MHFRGQFNIGDGWAIASINGTDIMNMPFVKARGSFLGLRTLQAFSWVERREEWL